MLMADAAGDAVLLAVEQACTAFQAASTDKEKRMDAERVLLELRRADGAVGLGLVVIERSHIPLAQFHGLLAVREGLGRQWNSLDGDARARLEATVLGLLTPAGLEHSVRAQACAVLALVAKRDSVDTLQGSMPTHAVAVATAGKATERLIAHASTLFGMQEPHKIVALLLLGAIVQEFGAPAEAHSTQGLGIPAGLQQGARLHFQTEHLPHLFDALVQLLFATAGDASVPADSAVLTRIVELLATVLGWDFAGTTGTVGAGEEARARPGLLAASVRPPAAWRGRADSLALVTASWELYGRQRACLTRADAGGAGSGSGAGGSERLPSFADGGGCNGGTTGAAAAAGGADGGAGAEGYGRVLYALHATRQLLAQLCSVHRQAFSDEAAQVEILGHHARALTQLVAVPLPPAAGAEAIAGELGEVAHMLQRLVSNFGAEAVGRLAPEDAAAFYGATATLTSRVADEATAVAVGADGGDDDHWRQELMEALWDVWVSLVTQLLHATSTTPGGLGHPLAHFTRPVVEASVRATLALARADADANGSEQVTPHAEDDAALDLRMGALAAVARADAHHSVELLRGCLAERTARLHALCSAIASQGAMQPAGARPPEPTASERAAVEMLMEELDVLVRLAGHVLADAGEGEAPSVPMGVAAVHTATPAQHPAAELTEAVCALMALQDGCVLQTGVDASGLTVHLQSGPGGSEQPPPTIQSPGVTEGIFSCVLSPRLAETLLWFFARWSRTYLLPDETTLDVLHPQLILLWGRESKDGHAMLVRCVDSAALRLLCWRGEPILAMHATRLLHTLARLKGSAELLASLTAWQRILAAHSPGSSELAHLPPKAQRLLVEALTRAGTAAPNAEAARRYLDSLCAPLSARLQQLTNARDLEPSHAPVQQEVVALCECLRAICRASARLSWRPSIAPAVRRELHGNLFAFVMSTARALLEQLLHQYAHALDTALRLLKLLSDLARAYALAPEVTMAQLTAMSALALAVTQRYVQHFAAAAHAVSASLADAGESGSELELLEEEQRSKHVLALLRTLTHLATALADSDHDSHGGGGDGAESRRAQAIAEVLAAFDLLLPLLGVRLLGYPKLCAGYYDLLAALLLLCRTPGAQPPSEQLERTAHRSFRFGVRHSTADVSRVSLEALYECAAHAVRVGGQDAPMMSLIRAAQHELLLDLVASEVHPDAVDPAAGNTLLALIAAEPDNWGAVVAHVVAQHEDPAPRDELASLFAQLLSANGVRRSLDKPNRARFRTNLQHFLMEAQQRPHITAVLSTRPAS